MSAAQKHEREVMRAVCALDPRLKVSIDLRGSVNAHKWLTVSLGDKSVRVACASSPTNPDVWQKLVVQNVRRGFRKLGIELQGGKNG
jgi:hypothetical protein